MTIYSVSRIEKDFFFKIQSFFTWQDTNISCRFGSFGLIIKRLSRKSDPSNVTFKLFSTKTDEILCSSFHVIFFLGFLRYINILYARLGEGWVKELTQR